MWFRSMVRLSKSYIVPNCSNRRATQGIALLVAAALTSAALPGAAGAAPIPDPSGDFLPTYTGPQDPGLDVLAHQVTLSGDRLILYGQMAGPVSPTQAIGGLYLFGLDRGTGTPRFLNSPAAPPVIGPNVVWDAVVRINPNCTGSFVNSLIGVTTALDPLDITISGNELTASIPVSLLLTASTKSPEQWTYNLWPRNGAGLNVQVSDLGPNDGNSSVQVVPEPVSLALCAIGAVGLLPCGRKRQRKLPVSSPRAAAVGVGSNGRWASIEPLEQRQMRSATPFVSVGDVNITEGNDGTRTAALTVSLSASPHKSVVVDFRTENGSATAGSDYQSVAGTLAFAKGQRSKTIVVPVYGDRLAEGNESFIVRLLSVSGAKIANAVGAVTIIDEEPRIFISDESALEGCGCFGSTPLTFSVWMAAAYDQPVTVNYVTADESATLANSDYTAAAGTITFAPGETFKTITIDVLGDVTVEVNEAFFVNLTSPFAGALVNQRGVGWILDDDAPPPPPPDDGGYVPPVECTPDYANYPLCN